MKTGLKISKISQQEMLNHEDGKYNMSVWNDRVKSVVSNMKDVQFYYAEKGNQGCDYRRYFASYFTPDGLFLFNSFDPFCSSLTSNGFCKVSIDEEGFVHKYFFKDSSGKEGYAENTKENRIKFAKSLTPLEIMVSNCI